MQGHSPELDVTLKSDHTAISAAEVVRNAKVIDDLELVAGSVSADRTGAQLRTIEFEAIDRNGTLIPEAMTSDLAPFGSRVQMYRGARNKKVSTQIVQYDAGHPWTPKTLTGQMVGLKTDTDGSLTLGP